MNEDTALDPEEKPPEKTALDLALDSARAAFPKRRLYGADSPAGILIFGDPALTQFQYYESLLYSDEAAIKASAPRELVLACAVIPDRRGVESLMKNGYPGLSRNPEVLRACSLASGITREAAEKK